MERDLADDLDELICAGYLNIDQDSLYNVAGLVFSVWVVVAILVYLAATYLVQSSAHKKESPKEIKEESVPQTVIPPEPQVAIASPEEKSVSAEDSIKFSAVVEKLDPLKTIGSDLEAVAWVNQCLDNIYSSSTLRATLIRQWLDALSRYIRSLDVEVKKFFASARNILPNNATSIS